MKRWSWLLLSLIIGGWIGHAIAASEPKPPSPPSMIRVGIFDYQVRTLKAPFECGEIKAADGCTSPASLVIIIGSDMPLRVSQAILWHEVKHAIHDAAGVSEAHLGDEDWIELEASSELMVLRDNPELVRYLLAR